jgi:hypothetical protein
MLCFVRLKLMFGFFPFLIECSICYRIVFVQPINVEMQLFFFMLRVEILKQIK